MPPRYLTATLFWLLPIAAVFGQTRPPIEGRWDLTVREANGTLRPSWFEVRHSGNSALVGQFVAGGGSARPVATVSWNAGAFRFAVPAQWERGANDLMVEGRLEGDSLIGVLTEPNGEKLSFSGKRAPVLRRAAAPRWGTPIRLFNGTSLAGWQAIQGANNWKVVNGVLTNTAAGANLRTERTFEDFKLHVEFRFPQRGNSGVYLRGRYEVQVEDSPGPEPAIDGLGAIYGFITPNQYVSKGPGVWHTYDVTLVGRTVTVVVNGKTVICEQVIPGPTGGALDTNEGAPGPIFFQGDHGPIEYRNVVITPAR